MLLPLNGSHFGFRLCRALCVALLADAAACSHNEAAPGAEGPASGAAESSSGAAPAGKNDLEGHGASVFVVHMVSDFDGFKKYFEEGAAQRAEGGVKGYLLSKLDDGRVVVHFYADDVGKVEAALKSAEMKRYLERDGAPDASLVWVTHNDVLKIPATPPTGQTFSLFLKVHVGDFGALKRGFEERHAVFAEQGVIAEGLHHSTAREEIAILHFVGTAREKLEALPKRKEFVELLAQAGRKDDAKPLVGTDVARSR